MRIRISHQGLSVHAISGTYVVLLGIDAVEAVRKGLLGFAIERSDHTEDERYWLKGFRSFEATNPDPCPGALHSTFEHPIQSFLWGDYTAKPDHDYSYRVIPVYGKPKKLEHGDGVQVNVHTESLGSGEHAIYFNRGAIASQAYARKFGNLPPAQTEDPEKAVAWLSRGLLEAALAFIRQARGGRFALRAAVYEFTYAPVLQAFKEAVSSGADVKIVYEAGNKGSTNVLTSTSEANAKAIEAVGLDDDVVIPRRKRKQIPHNKFIVLLENGLPIEVWTGSTNFTESGFLGQSNVGHIVRNHQVAALYNQYWEQLADDADWPTLRAWTMANTPRPGDELPENSISVIFSPRTKSAMLNWYAQELGEAEQTVMFTAAFGVQKKLAREFAVDKDFLRFLITERKLTGESGELVKRDRDTIIALGSTLGRDAKKNKLPGWKLDKWFLEEELFRKRGWVFYIHTKYLLIDVLTDDPLIFTGSANFSVNSLLRNDENMLLIRGNTSVSDIYLGEFLRLFNHFYFRYIANLLAQQGRLDEKRSVYLEPTDIWTKKYFKPGTFHFKRRELFR